MAPARRGSTVQRVVYRMPRHSTTIPGTVAVLNELEKWPRLRAPGVVFHQDDDNHALGIPVVVIDRIPGRDLEHTWLLATHHQKLCLARQLGEMHRDFLAATESNSGIIRAASDNHPNTLGASSEAFLEPLGSNGMFNLDSRVRQLAQNRNDGSILEWAFLNSRRPANNPYDILLYGLRCRKLQSQVGRQLIYTMDTYRLCQEMLEVMRSIGIFEERAVTARSSLWHPDLFPRNIMAMKKGREKADLTGIIDWDGAMYAPSFASCSPPTWMWKPCYFGHQGRCPDCGRDEQDRLDVGCDAPLTAKDIEIREAFDDAAGPDWRFMAYEPVFIFARKIFTIILNRNITDERYDQQEEADLMLEMWEGHVHSQDFRDRWGFIVL
jgi:hypothetical protein